MAKNNKPPVPIMSPDEEKYMAFEGLIQWTAAVIAQSARVSAASDYMFREDVMFSPTLRRRSNLDFSTQCHFFAISANKILEFRKWSVSLGLFAMIDFSQIDQFSTRDILDLRNMREHVVEYFQGKGHTPTRWTVATPEYKADASSVIGTVIGGRLDWLAFTSAAEHLYTQLLQEPIPYPAR